MGKVLSGELVRAMDFEVWERVEEEEVDDDSMDVDEDTIVIKPELEPEEDLYGIT
jgi:hypothetical protein